MKVIVIIPARYASTRFPGKPLAVIHGLPMVQRVYQQAFKAKGVDEVYVATDDKRIFDCVEQFGGKAIMTAEDHPSGTDRIYEAYTRTGVSADLVINVQGDEPYIQPEQIEQVISIFSNPEVQVGTLVKAITSTTDLFNINKVKAVVSVNGRALYFSRQPLPYFKGFPEEMWTAKHQYYKHIGMYAFRPATLEKLVKLPVSTLERAESLEQLRWLEHGFDIYTAVTELEAHAIDTPEDLALLLQGEH
ncbi:MAG: 3-deoxy-manno-octulosonate cytidylyltransferase [Bacteroidota bacterium]